MRLRTKLLVGILGILLLQIAVTGTFTLSTFVVNTRRSQESELSSDWGRARAYVEELKHRLTTDIYQLSFFLQEDQAAGASASDLRGMMRSFISLTSADRIVLIDEPGLVIVDERTGAMANGDDLPVPFLNFRDFSFPRNQFMATKFVSKPTRLYLVTGSSFPRRGGGVRHLFLVTNVDKSMVEAIWEKTGTEVAFFPGPRPSSPPLPGRHLKPMRRCGRGASSWAMSRTACIRVRCRRTSRTKITSSRFVRSWQNRSTSGPFFSPT